VHERAAELQCSRDGVRHGSRDRPSDGQTADAAAPLPALLGLLELTAGGLVHQQYHHAGERHAIRHAVVQARDERRALAVAVDEVHMPERLRAVEQQRDQVRHQLLECAAVARWRQREPVEVQVDVEVRVVLPDRAAEAVLVDALAELREALDDARPDDLLEEVPVDRLLEPEQGVDHHQVRRPVHVEPGRVRAPHRLAHRAIIPCRHKRRAPGWAAARR
jgi:ClpP class serine protease